jgi:hypothetical protein
VAAAGLAPAAATAQGDSVTVVAGAEYRASPLHRTVLGDSYRDVWTTPVRVATLDLRTFAGGLTPTQRGGGNQTRSLRFRTPAGREYAFRSMNKEQTRALSPDVQGTIAGRVVQDQVSSLHPLAGLVTEPLLAAVGVLHVRPRLVALPRTGLPAEFAEFHGLVGTLEERPRAGNSEIPEIASAADVEDTEEFMEALEGDPSHRLDTRDYLAGRFMDLIFGDWDRHEDQYNWVRHERGGVHYWRALPRDRDYSFVDYDGLVLDLARGTLPKAVRFDPEYDDELFGLIQNAQFLDRRLLGDLDRAAWDSVAARVRASLTDATIDAAVRRLPPEYYAVSGDFLRARLRERRDQLPEVAAKWYGWMASEAEIHATDKRDRALVEHAADGSTTVTLASGGATYYRRRFVPAETREVRIHLHGGADQATVRGGAGAITTRIVGGGGDDVLADSSAARVRFYDDRGDNRFTRGRRTRVDTREYTPPAYERGAGATPPRDWGRESTPFDFYATWRSRIGPVIGGGPGYESHGFRASPFSGRGNLNVVWAPLHTRFGVELRTEHHFAGTRRWGEVDARATQLANTDFFGYGNDTPPIDDSEGRRVWERQLSVQPRWHFPLSGRTWLSLGPSLRVTRPEIREGTRAAADMPDGSHAWGALGGRAGLLLDRVDNPAFPRLGFTLGAEAAGFPAVTELDGPFGTGGVTATAYLGAPVGPVLAFRGGARAAWGDFPFQEAPTVGGSSTLRGFRSQRYAGDAAVNGSVELRQPIARVNLGVRGTLGAFALADAGRVYVDGDSPGGWRAGAGGGLFFNFLDRSRTVAVTYARGERNEFYVDFGMPF